MDNRQNLESYNDVENLERFNEDSFAEYCRMKLDTAKTNINFIKKYVFPKRGLSDLSVCEIGSGNGKLLYALEAQMFNGGELVGYEVSKSRCQFAEKFKAWMGSKCVTIRNEDVLSSRTEEKFDLIIGVDIVTQIIAPLYDMAEQKYFNWIRQHLTSEGRVFLEFQDYSQALNVIQAYGARREWEEFPDEDPFQYGLYNEFVDADGNLVWEKRFFEKKARKFSCFSNVIKNYTVEQALSVMSAAGFSVEIYDSPEVLSEMGLTDLEQRYKVFYVVARLDH